MSRTEMAGFFGAIGSIVLAVVIAAYSGVISAK